MMRQLPRFAEPKCICRLFSTHLPRLQPAPPPSPPSFPPPSNRDTPSSTTYTPSRKAPTPYSSPRSALNARSNRSANNPDAFTLASTLAAEASLRTDLDRVSQYDRKRADMEELEKSGRGRDLEKFMVRKWKPGDVYAPHDLSSVEMGKWGKRRAAERDVFDMLGINPLNEYKVRSLLTPSCLSVMFCAVWEGGRDADGCLCANLEFRDDGGVYDSDGADTTSEGYGSSSCESEEDRQGDSEGGRYGVDPERA